MLAYISYAHESRQSVHFMDVRISLTFTQLDITEPLQICNQKGLYHVSFHSVKTHL
uniref:Uncharacterized protein n=1 Tax=Rhizophora mucronata TaxID=61149 RepID=A0A2P2NZJ4_RHIMU